MGQITHSLPVRSQAALLAIPTLMEGALYLSLPFEMFTSRHKTPEPLAILSQFPLISKDALTS